MAVSIWSSTCHEGKGKCLVEDGRFLRVMNERTLVRAGYCVLTACDGEECVRTMKESAVFDKPYIKKSARIGAQDFPPEFYAEMTNFAPRELPIFNSRQRALDWLVSIVC
jgi:hypothetical protein